MGRRGVRAAVCPVLAAALVLAAVLALATVLGGCGAFYSSVDSAGGASGAGGAGAGAGGGAADVRVYRGIPYAEPPVGELRFSPPVATDTSVSFPRGAEGAGEEPTGDERNAGNPEFREMQENTSEVAAASAASLIPSVPPSDGSQSDPASPEGDDLSGVPSGGMRETAAADWSRYESAVFGPTEVQKTPVGDLPMSEDCLTLNIWTPAGAVADAGGSGAGDGGVTGGDAGGAGLPVYVFIHGGAFVHGSGADPRYDGSAFARDGIVYVSINYRFGAFGYYASQETLDLYGTTGNWGLLDQICALRWVQRHIADFGGDPDNVTIGGHSAGAYSVSALLLSPLARGLFRRAILESGTILGLDALNLRTQGDLGRSMDATALMLPGSLAEARDIPAEDVAGAIDYHSDFTYFSVSRTQELCASDGAVSCAVVAGPSLFLTPTFDGAALPADPRAALADGDFNAADLLIGYTADEGSRFIPDDVSKAGYRTLLNYIYANDSDAVYKAYPVTDEKPACEQARNVFAVAAFSGGAHTYADAYARAGHDVFLYDFTYETASARKSGLGAQHGAELPYVFANFAAYGMNRPTAHEKELADIMHAAWVYFIKTGDPNGEGIECDATREESAKNTLPVWWPAYDPADSSGPQALYFGDGIAPAAATTPAILQR